MIRNDFLRDVGGIELAGLRLLRDLPHGLDNLNPAAVAQRHDESQAVVLGKRGDGFCQMLLHVVRQAMNLADDFQPDIVFVQLLRLGLEVVNKIFHQRVHLVFRTIPILRRKRVKREIFDAEFAGGADDFARGIRAAPVALDARQVPRLGPAPIAVHDHSDVAREIRGGFGAQMWNGETHLIIPKQLKNKIYWFNHGVARIGNIYV